MCVCVCVCVRARARARIYIYMYVYMYIFLDLHLTSDYFNRVIVLFSGMSTFLFIFVSCSTNEFSCLLWHQSASFITPLNNAVPYVTLWSVWNSPECDGGQLIVIINLIRQLITNKVFAFLCSNCPAVISVSFHCDLLCKTFVQSFVGCNPFLWK